MSLDRVVFITTDATASASEAVIVGLKPFMQTVMVGGTTHGKPVGSDGFDIGNKIINAIQFKGRNAASEEGYFNGLIVDCQADDGMTFELGDQRETSLKTALDYISSGTCPAYAVEKKPKQLLKKKTMGLKGFQAEIGAF